MIVQEGNGWTNKGKILPASPKNKTQMVAVPSLAAMWSPGEQRQHTREVLTAQPSPPSSLATVEKQGQNKTRGACSAQKLFCEAAVARGSGCFSFSFSLSLGTHIWPDPSRLWLGWNCPWCSSCTGAVFSKLGLHGKMTSWGPAVMVVPSGQPITSPQHQAREHWPPFLFPLMP